MKINSEQEMLELGQTVAGMCSSDHKDLARAARSVSEEHVAATATIEYFGKRYVITASGNGPLDAFVAVMRRTSAPVFNITSFHEHAIGSGSNTHAMAYVQITFEDGTSKWGVGKSSNVGRAGIAAVVSALNFEE